MHFEPQFDRKNALLERSNCRVSILFIYIHCTYPIIITPTKIPPDKALIVELLDLLTDFPAVLWNGVPLLLPTVAVEALGLPPLKPLIIKATYSLGGGANDNFASALDYGDRCPRNSDRWTTRN